MPEFWFWLIVFIVLPVVLIVNIVISAYRVKEAEEDTEKMCKALKNMRDEMDETERRQVDYVVDTYRELIERKPFSIFGKMFAGANIEAAKREVEKNYFVYVIGSQENKE